MVAAEAVEDSAAADTAAVAGTTKNFFQPDESRKFD
jgi:hypothetical protein